VGLTGRPLPSIEASSKRPKLLQSDLHRGSLARLEPPLDRFLASLPGLTATLTARGDASTLMPGRARRRVWSGSYGVGGDDRLAEGVALGISEDATTPRALGHLGRHQPPRARPSDAPTLAKARTSS
jgi:hypothetical protein